MAHLSKMPACAVASAAPRHASQAGSCVAFELRSSTLADTATRSSHIDEHRVSEGHHQQRYPAGNEREHQRKLQVGGRLLGRLLSLPPAHYLLGFSHCGLPGSVVCPARAYVVVCVPRSFHAPCATRTSTVQRSSAGLRRPQETPQLRHERGLALEAGLSHLECGRMARAEAVCRERERALRCSGPITLQNATAHDGDGRGNAGDAIRGGMACCSAHLEANVAASHEVLPVEGLAARL